MADNTSALKALIKGALEAIAEEKGVSASFDEIHLERPKQEDHGDWATNAAMKNCKVLGCAPRDLAQEIARRITDLQMLLEAYRDGTVKQEKS